MSKIDLETLEEFNSFKSLNKSEIIQNNYNEPNNVESNNFISKTNLTDHVTMHVKPLPRLYPVSRKLHPVKNYSRTYNRNSLNIVTDREYIRLNKTDSMINEQGSQKNIQFNSKNSYLLNSARCSKSALLLPVDQVNKNKVNDMPDNLIKCMRAVS